MKMRKLIALLSAVLMLCTIIPMGALTVSAASAYSEDFEDGTVGNWTNNNSVVGAADLPVANAAAGSYTLKFVSTSYHYTNAMITVEKNTTYRVTFSILSGEASKPVNVRIRTGSSVDLSINQYTPSTTAWETHTMVFNSGDNTSLNFRFQAGHSTGTYYIDNLSIESITDSFSDDGYMKNGNFETGMADNWYGTANTEVIDDPTGSGQGKVMHTFETEKVNMISQNISIVTGESYVLNFKVYGYASVSNSAFYVRFGGPAYTTIDTTTITHTLASISDTSDTWTRQIRMNMNSNKGAWQTVSIPFTAAKDGNIPIAIYNYRTSAGNYYFDDFSITGPNNPETPEEPEEPEQPTTTTNLIVNGDLETGDTTGWESYSGTTVATSPVHGGSYSLTSGNTASKYQTMAKQIITATTNTDYTLTYWYYYDGSNAQPSFYTYIQDTAGTNLANVTTYPSAAGTWGQVTLSFNSGENTSITIYVKNRTAEDGGIYYFDDFEIPAPATTEPEEPEQPNELEDPVAGNLVQEGTFEGGSKTGWSLYNNSVVSTSAAYKGSYGLQCYGSGWNGIANTTVNTEVGKSYQLSFWYKINVAGFNWKITGPVSGTKYAGAWQNTNLGTWQQIVVEFVADDTTAKLSFSGLDESSTPDFYVDTVSIVEIQGPSNDGFIVNGDFEVGKTIGWEIYQSTAVSADAANSSSYGINLVGNGGWGGILKQSFTTKKGYKYVLTLDLKVNNYGVNMKVCNAADDATLVYKWFDATNNGAWATYTFEFTAISDSCYINFNGGGGGSSTGGENVYVDNVGITEIPCEHEYDGIQDADCNICGEVREVPLVDIVTSGQTSASEDVNGLAFKFEIAATGATTDNNNKYVAGSASIKPFGNDDYTLVAMGAVITNQADKATNDLLNLNTVNGKNIIKVEAVYLLENGSDSLAFATRIINIPEANASTNIYARSYYVFEKDGELVVIYDNIVTQNYTAAIG